MDEEDDAMRVVATIVVSVHAGGALSVQGPIDNVNWCVAALENAKDAVRNRGKRRKELIIPAKDVTIP